MWWTILIILMLLVLLAFLGSQFWGAKLGRKRPVANLSEGTLTVTGVSPRRQGDSNSQAYCTLSGTIIGADIAPTEVYGNFMVNVNDPWPSVGDELPVHYKPGSVDSSWRIASDTL